MFRGEVEVEPRLTVGKAERQRRLIPEIDPVEDVLQIALAKRRQPRAAPAPAPGAFHQQSPVRRAPSQLCTDVLPCAFARFLMRLAGRLDTSSAMVT